MSTEEYRRPIRIVLRVEVEAETDVPAGESLLGLHEKLEALLPSTLQEIFDNYPGDSKVTVEVEEIEDR